MNTQEVANRLVELGRITMNEINVYKVENGKIVEEQFFY